MPAETDPVVIPAPAGQNDPVIIPAPTPSPESGGMDLQRIKAGLPPGQPFPEAPAAGLSPYIVGATEAVVPQSLGDLVRMAILPREEPVDVERENELAAEWRGERGPEAQARSITGTLMAAAPLAHLPFSESPLRPSPADLDLDNQIMLQRAQAAQPPPIPEQYQGRFTMQATPPEAPPLLAPAPPIEQTLPQIGQPLPFNPEFGPLPPQTEFQMPLRTEFGRLPGGQDLQLSPPPGTDLKPIALRGPNGGTPALDAVTAQAQPQGVQLPVSPEGGAPLIQPGDESYAGVTPQTGEVPPSDVGVAERYREEQQPGSVTPGIVQDAAYWRGKGREYINAGGDPRMPIRAAQVGHVSPRNVGIVSAQYELLAEQTQSAAQAVQANPGNAQAVAALDNASRAQAAWSTEMQPVFTRASESLSAIQGKLPVDETTFAGLYDKALELNGGQPLPKPQQAELVRRSAKAARARSAERQTYAKLEKAVPGRAPTDAEMKARVEDMVKRLTPC